MIDFQVRVTFTFSILFCNIDLLDLFEIIVEATAWDEISSRIGESITCIALMQWHKFYFLKTEVREHRSGSLNTILQMRLQLR